MRRRPATAARDDAGSQPDAPSGRPDACTRPSCLDAGVIIEDDAGLGDEDAGTDDAGSTMAVDAGTDSGADAGGAACSPVGVVLPCAGADGCSGFRTCEDPGFWSGCDCPDAGASCGGTDEPCCPDVTTPCRFPESICSGGTCLHCGYAGEPCCGGDTCLPPGLGGPRTACAASGMCEECGGRYEVCCTSGPACDDTRFPCNARSLDAPNTCDCGGNGEACCPTGVLPGGVRCEVGLTCTAASGLCST